MLKFERIPPTKPEDVNISEEAKDKFHSIQGYSVADGILVGRALGSVLFENAGENLDKELLQGIVRHLEVQIARPAVTRHMLGAIEARLEQLEGVPSV